MPENVNELGVEITEAAPPKQPTIKDQTRKWSTLISQTLDVRTIIQYLSTAERGNTRYQMEMFVRMIERDPHLQAVLQTRRMALTQAEWSITPGDEEDSRAIDAADMVRDELMNLPSFDDSVEGLLDGIGMGLAGQEIIYSDDWGLENLVEIPQNLFDWQEPDLRIIADGFRPEPMIPNKFVIHTPRTRPGAAVRRGLMRTLAVYWCISHFAMEDWAGYSEVFGQPLRLGMYPSGSKTDDIATLWEALQGMGSDAAGMIPEGMSIEFPQPPSRATSGTITPMETIISYIEKKMSILVLGQNLTTESESGSGTLAGNAHERVRRDLTRADARQLSTTLRRDLFTPLTGFRMGWDVPVPKIKWDLDDPVDQQMRAGVIKTMVEIGFPVSKAQVREELQLVEPADDEDLLKQQPSLGAGLFSTTSALAASTPTTRGLPIGTAARANEKLTQAAAAEGGSVVDKIMELVGEWAASAKSPEEVMTRIKLNAHDLEDLLAQQGLSMEEFKDLVARTLMTADLNGRVAVRAEREV